MPKVTAQFRVSGLMICLVAAFTSRITAQPGKSPDVASNGHPAEVLYEKLRTVGLDSSGVFRIREASLDRASLHVSLNDGTIAFTEDVAGRITGAFFAGDGEVLLSPPDQIERSSIALFTGAAILEEKFSTAYLRFNDDTFKELKPSLRPQENPDAFIVRWNDSARVLAEDDALRLLTTFSRLLLINKAADPVSDGTDPRDRMLHLKLQGLQLGVFDVFYDLTAREQISAGQLRKVDGNSNYDVWTSFALKKEQPAGANVEVAGDQGDRGEIEISQYKIKAEIYPPTQLDAEARLQMLVRHGGERAVLFELSRYLKIREVDADGVGVEFIHNPALDGTRLERKGDDLVAVVFPEPLRDGQQIELHFSYAGAVLSEAGGGLPYVGSRGTWYPNRGFSKAGFDLEFHYPAAWTLVATGKRQDEAAFPEKMPAAGSSATHLTQVSRWVSDRPIPVAGFNLGKYSRVTKQAGPAKVEVYAASSMERAFPRVVSVDATLVAPFPLSPASNAESVGGDAVRAINFFSARFGPYPYSDLAITQMPGPLSQGWPGLIFLSSFAFLSPDQKSALHMSPIEQTISDGVIAHETAHQWWGDFVTWRSYRDQWIMEALANYSSLLLLEESNPSKFRALMEKYRDDLLQKNNNGLRYMDAGPVTLGARLTSSKFPDGYGTVAYQRGAWLLHMLRTMMRDAGQKGSPGGRRLRTSSDEPFLQALRTVGERYQTQPISTPELMRIFEEYLPRSAWYEGRQSLAWFYQGWLNGTAVPGLALSGVRCVDKANSTIVTGVIRQGDATESLVTSVPLYASLIR